MNNTVRSKIVAAVKTGILAAGSGRVGAVVMPGQSLDVVAEQLRTGKFAVEVIIGDDEPGEPRQLVEEASFDVGLLVYMPPSLVDASSASEVAADINGDLYLVYAADEAAGQWGGFAQRTDFGGFGDAYLSDSGQHVTVQGFRITYRFTRGNPTEAR